MLSDKYVKLDEISREYFNLSRQSALSKARLGILPVPAFRLLDSQKAPWFVARTDLDAYVANKVAAAAKLHQQMSVVRSAKRR